MNNLDEQYKELLQDILDNGITKKDRTGTGTKSVFGRTIRHKMSEGFPLLTTKKMPFKTITTELLWFLRGDTNIKYLVDNGCNIWNGDAYKHYVNENNKAKKRNPHSLIVCLSFEEFIHTIKTTSDKDFIEKWGELGPIYGKQWRKWGVKNKVDEVTGEVFIGNQYVDQIYNLIHDLKTNPDSRRLMVNAWNVGEIKDMTLPPCHYGFQCYTRELSLEERVAIWDEKYLKDVEPQDYMDQLDLTGIPERELSLSWNQRSVDTFLGLPFNIASYGLLLEILAKEVNMIPGELIGNLGDTHLYLNHLEQAKEQIGYELTDEEYSQALKDADLETFNKIVACKAEKLRVIESQDYELAADISNTEKELIKSMPLVEYRTRTPLPLPTLDIKLHFDNDPSFVPEHWLAGDFDLLDYKSHDAIKAPLSN